jgi:hypothetical protein
MTLAAKLTYTSVRMESLNNIIAKYAGQATKLEQLVSAISPELIVLRPEDTRWSMLEIVCHLADAELLASVRIRRIITQDRPNLWGYQQEQWATALGYRHRRIETVLARFVLLRRENAELIEDLAEEIWHQTGAHDMYGTLSLEQLIEDYLTHTAKHLDQIGSVAADVASLTNVGRLTIERKSYGEDTGRNQGTEEGKK